MIVQQSTEFDMSRAKRERREALGDPSGLAMSMTTQPGAPMNNNPMNVTGLGNSPTTMDGRPLFYPYGDIPVDPARMGTMGTQAVDPMMVPRSPMPQQMPRGAKSEPYGAIQQPDSQMQAALPGEYHGFDAQKRGLNPSSMGPLGMPVDTQVPIIGNMPQMGPDQQSPMQLGLQGMQDAQMAAGPPVQGKGGMGTNFSGQRA